MRGLGTAVALAMAVSLVVACDAAPFVPAACQPLPPSSLPSGAATGAPRTVEVEGRWLVTWSAGDEQVVQAVDIGGAEGSKLDADHGLEAAVRGQAARVVAIGDPPISQVAIHWSVGPCSYTTWVGPGLTLDEAIAYAGRY